MSALEFLFTFVELSTYLFFHFQKQRTQKTTNFWSLNPCAFPKKDWFLNILKKKKENKPPENAVSGLAQNDGASRRNKHFGHFQLTTEENTTIN